MSAPRLLYYAPRSAPSRTVLMVARYLKVDLELKLVRLDQGEHKTPEFLKVIWYKSICTKTNQETNHSKSVYCLQVNFIYIHYAIPFF